MNTNKAFKCGSDAALDAMDVLGKTFDGKHNAYAKDALQPGFTLTPRGIMPRFTQENKKWQLGNQL